MVDVAGSRFCMPRACLGVIFVLVVFVAPIQAAQWDTSKDLSVSLREVYSDNINRSSTDKKSRFTSLVNVYPTFSLKGEGARARVNLTGSLGYRAGGGNARSFNPRLNGKANAELLRKYLFIDASASVTETVIDPFGDITIDEVNDTGNTTLAYQYQFSPYFKAGVSDVGSVEARYRFSGTGYSEGRASGSSDNSFSLIFDTDVGSSQSRFTWGISNDYRKSVYEGADGRDYKSTDLNLGYRFNRRWRMNGSLGREWNDYPSDDSTIGGFRWTLNTTWTPNPRLSLLIGYGGRYFGSTPKLDLSYKSRRSTIKLGYSRILTDANTELATLAIDPITKEVYPVAILIDDVFIDERVTASYSLQGKRTTLTLSGTQSTQEYENSLQESELTRLGLSLSRSLTGNVGANVGMSWNQQDRAANDSAETWQASLGLNVSVGRGVSLSLGYTFNKRDDDQPSDSYEENRATLALTYSL